MNAQNFLIVDGCKLIMTCEACPEQYDVYFENIQIGYFRLRHGRFSASYPNSDGDVIFSASPEGDGIFEDHERFTYLKAAVAALVDKHNKQVLDFQYHY